MLPYEGTAGQCPGAWLGINTGFIYIPEGWKVNWFIFARLSEPLKKHPSPSACHRQAV